ncbi:hypothetical protein [Halarcobacter ebronensis]|uniref:Uncharacterized protein n=1 Tax=Halarcobacter ebronensis TaxID=1462615 RepID=A0A4Q1AT57_9BACT|nr:hypothetical protein [Halarcobacter ebronensis]QKF82938.1 hypothetical protein AEBR_2471 [Halarcobacter ebronensis]RXK06953.1 hypothetical protein CRV07_05865 [Halarcobacter ebronensis]
MEKLAFNILQILEEKNSCGERYVSPDVDTFKNLDESFNIQIDNVYYEVIIELDSSYIWFSFDFGKTSPRDEKLTNILTGEKRDNEREPVEAELIQQFFCLYIYSTKSFFISNLKKKNVFQAVLKSKLNKNFCLKTIYKTQEEFINIINSIQKISFTHLTNIFSHDSKKRQALIDLTGTDAPENFTIEATYEKSKILGFVLDLLNSKDSYKDLVITGLDESNFEVVFNNDTFNKKIEVKAIKNENGKYCSNQIKEGLLKEIDEK